MKQKSTRQLKREADRKTKKHLKALKPEKLAGLADGLKQWAADKGIKEEDIQLKHIEQFAKEAVQIRTNNRNKPKK